MRWSRVGTAEPGLGQPTAPATSPRRPWTAFALLAGVVLVSAVLLSGAPADEKRISLYSTLANYSLPVVERDGRDYVGLLEILEPLGTVSAKGDRQRWRLRYNDVEGEFSNGRTRARIRGRDFDLAARFLLENGRGLVPLAALSALMPRFLGGPVTFHETSRRVFVGSVATHFTAEISRIAPPRLVLDFSSPVNPTIATEPGKLRMVFTHEPLVASGAETLTFNDKIISSATYQESNGAAEIAVTGSVPLMASFSNDGRTITIASAPQAAQNPPSTPALAPAAPPAAPAPPAAHRFFAVVDASHGGEERGAALSDTLAEKDLTLALARRLRQELEQRGLPALALRDGDTTLSLEQRANLTNTTHPVLYISVHVASQGHGVRLYTGLLPAAEENRGVFLAWDTAQISFLPLSQAAAASVAAELQKKQVPVRTLAAPLRPLNNITAAALAVEVAPPGTDPRELTAPAYQQLLTSAIADGVAAARKQLEAAR